MINQLWNAYVEAKREADNARDEVSFVLEEEADEYEERARELSRIANEIWSAWHIADREAELETELSELA